MVVGIRTVMTQRMPLHKILCFAVLAFVFVRQGLFAQCGQATQNSAVSAASAALTPSRTGKEDLKNRIVELQLELNEKGAVSSVQVLSGPEQLRAAAAKAAKRKYMGRNTWPGVRVEVKFPHNGHGAPEMSMVFSPSGVPGCVVPGGGSVVYIPWPGSPTAPPSWLFNTRLVIPTISASKAKKLGQ
jgi:hypothetical protein